MSFSIWCQVELEEGYYWGKSYDLTFMGMWREGNLNMGRAVRGERKRQQMAINSLGIHLGWRIKINERWKVKQHLSVICLIISDDTEV